MPGEQFVGEMAFYPARAPLRAVLLGRDGEGSAALPWPEPSEAVAEALMAPWLAEPWADARPILLPVGRIGFDRAGAPWWRAQDGAMVLPVGGEVSGLVTGTELTRSAALWSGGRLKLLAAQTAWGRIGG